MHTMSWNLDELDNIYLNEENDVGYDSAEDDHLDLPQGLRAAV